MCRQWREPHASDLGQGARARIERRKAGWLWINNLRGSVVEHPGTNRFRGIGHGRASVVWSVGGRRPIYFAGGSQPTRDDAVGDPMELRRRPARIPTVALYSG